MGRTTLLGWVGLGWINGLDPLGSGLESYLSTIALSLPIERPIKSPRSQPGLDHINLHKFRRSLNCK